MSKLWDMVDGYKSYLVAMAAVACGVYMGYTGVMPWPEVVDYVLGGGALVAVKSALNKVGKKHGTSAIVAGPT